MRIPVDHLVYATPDLERGVKEIERLIGVSPTPGGQHPGRGTRNALVALGPDVYLEIVATDPDQPSPATPRWLGIDTIVTSTLTTWAAKSSALAELRARAVENGVPLGEVKSGARQRPDGARLSWQLTEPEPLIEDGVIPFFIDWGGSPHPARSLPGGATLTDLRIEHPDVERVQRMLDVLGLDVTVTSAATPALVAIIDGPHGRVELR